MKRNNYPATHTVTANTAEDLYLKEASRLKVKSPAIAKQKQKDIIIGMEKYYQQYGEMLLRVWENTVSDTGKILLEEK